MSPTSGIASTRLVMGVAGARRNIELITRDVGAVLGFRAEDLLGVRLEQLIVNEDRASLAALLDLADGRRPAGAKVLRFLRRERASRRCRLYLAARVPGEGYAFSFLPVPDDDPRASRARRRTWPIDEHHVPPDGELDRLCEAGLTPREAQVVAALLQGDRTPGIARKLYLTPGTVRNHLSSAFHKFGVTSQQELVDALRARRE